MAMTSCHECGAKISTDAKSCPHCGAEPRRTSLRSWIVGGVLLAAIIGGLTGKSAPTAPPKTPEQLETERVAKEAETARYSAALAVADAVKRSAREPESVKFHALRVSDDAALVCAEFRGRNGFGGMSPGHVLMHAGKLDDSIGAWNKGSTDYCVEVEP